MMIRYPTMHLNFLDHRMGKSADAETVKGEPMLARGIGYVVADGLFTKDAKIRQMITKVRAVVAYSRFRRIHCSRRRNFLRHLSVPRCSPAWNSRCEITE
ncbi:hypothetical protein AJ87_01080 [Rhizobium yanglingense]|nr:hypothetical protein AJ87_01080 [Rhizobium yanglingense]